MDFLPLDHDYSWSLRSKNDDLPTILIDRIPLTVQLCDLALLPFEDQDDDDFGLSRYEEDGVPYYSIFVALKRAGMIERAQDFFEDVPGCLIQVTTLGHCRQNKRNTSVDLPRPWIQNDAKSNLEPFSCPVDLMEMAFLTAYQPGDQHAMAPLVQSLAACKDSLAALPQARRKARTMICEAVRLDMIARAAVSRKKLLEQAQRKSHPARGILEQDFDEEASLKVDDAKLDAYNKILKADSAREAAEVAVEIACFHAEHGHVDLAPPIIELCLIHYNHETFDFRFDSSELADPSVFTEIGPNGSRRWQFRVPLRREDISKCKEHITNTLIDQGYNAAEFTVSFYSARKTTDKHVQIDFTEPTDYSRAENLALDWHMHKLDLVASAAPLPDNMTVLKVPNILAGQDEQEMIDHCIRSLEERLVFEDVWRLDQVDIVDGEEIATEGDSFIARVSFRPAQGLDDVPGYVTTPNGRFPLLLLGRDLPCGVCKGEGTLDYHTSEECEWTECWECGDGVFHRYDACPLGDDTD
ncbi:uncharacterized protein SRS1_14793 [Sporisorium reilianum f. sp. reilianum]|uniref:Uncharacterized protein n=1 Tax=Sporisorium reilianum f. sp. reilianum TaxID=72559 RepID=A0A2N8UH96_9BASI|nr:uncharacterized protein SRS1_14793 [Sporisorium reilianum f. sp. reilianum]